MYDFLWYIEFELWDWEYSAHYT